MTETLGRTPARLMPLARASAVSDGSRRRSRKTDVGIDRAGDPGSGLKFLDQREIEIAQGQPAVDLLWRLRRGESGLRLAIRDREFIELRAICADGDPRRPNEPQRLVLQHGLQVSQGHDGRLGRG